MRRLPAAALLFLAACATPPRVAYNRNADFGSIRRVAVVTFSGERGDLAADILAQALMARGADVVERQQLGALLKERQLEADGTIDRETALRIGKILGVDALFVGTVSRSQAEQSYVVSRGRRGGVTPVAGRSMINEGPLLGAPGHQVVTSNAQAGVVARMVDVRTGSILWSASMNDEAFELQTAFEAIADELAESLESVWPALGKIPQPPAPPPSVAPPPPAPPPAAPAPAKKKKTVKKR